MIRTTSGLMALSLASGIACMLANSANAQLVSNKDLSLPMAVTMAQSDIAAICPVNWELDQGPR